MSRIADAMQRVPGLGPEAERFHDDEHPWDLGSHGVAEGPPPAPSGFQPRRPVTPISAPREFRKGNSPAHAAATTAKVATAIDDSLRPHLAALVERVFAPVSGEPPRAVAFSGVGAGSALIAAATADMLAFHTGSTVCLVDGNFSAPSLHSRFGLEQGPGLIDAIAEGLPLTELLQEIRPNLCVMPAGTGRHRPSFASDAVRIHVAQLFARFDYVLVDIEPVSEMRDATGLAPLVDGVILVLSADATRRESAKRAAHALQGIGASILGAVLTNRRFPIPDALYRRL
jgi:protein-tyrosine kinase